MERIVISQSEIDFICNALLLTQKYDINRDDLIRRLTSLPAGRRIMHLAEDEVV